MLVELACHYQGPRHFFNASVHLRKFRIADDFAIHGNPLINPYQMGRGVETSFVSGLEKNACQHRRSRPFSIRAGNDDARKPPLRVFETFDKHLHMRKVELATRLLVCLRPELRSKGEQVFNS